ncbi:MAG TPA: hypothetical protein VHL98_18950 [Microvirga sp.]|jgi:hypothetical protein|nr:hypothetical protein [Microvirga sp.]
MRRMLGSVVLALAFIAAAHSQPAPARPPTPLTAQPAPPPPAVSQRSFNRVVPTGERRRIGFYVNLNPDCSVTGPVTLRTVQAPQRGTLSFVKEPNFVTYAPPNPREACNNKRHDGTALYYETADDEYSGLDEFVVLIMGPEGLGLEDKYTVWIR